MFGLVALLTPPTRDIQSKFPRTLLRTYVDDRSWASDTCYEALAVESIGVGRC